MIGLALAGGGRLAVVAAAAGLVIGFAGGWRLRDLQAAEAEARAAAASEALTRSVLEAERRQADLTQALGERAAIAQAEIQWRTQTLIREVPVHVTDQDDARCIVPHGFVRLHDAAATGSDAVPEPARGPDDAASGLALSAVAETVVGNYGTCEGVRRQLVDLQGWVRGVGDWGAGQNAENP